MRYEERLTVPRFWHLGAAVCAGIVGSYFTVYTDSTGIRVAVYGSLFVVMEVALWLLGRPRLTVTDETVSVAGQVVARDSVRDGAACADIRAVLAPGMFAVTRPWIRTGVWLRTADGVWVLSSRRPDELRAALGYQGL
ncbi:DUF3093 family protein [Frankia sp. Cppng1_Ct_nod]|uniref:DUF3093 family protein n=1 Tax=Frankia sp. Cppng1_Ct_nod TaxID=2897162 RepID=UPI0013EF8C7A|nr:DUF3093 family protein [Frankia sp. Cppng1_Ct_nod]